MLELETGADMRLVHQINAGMKIQAGGEHGGCCKVGESPDSQVICVQCQDEVVRICPGSPRSPRRAIGTRLSSGSAGNASQKARREDHAETRTREFDDALLSLFHLVGSIILYR